MKRTASEAKLSEDNPNKVIKMEKWTIYLEFDGPNGSPLRLELTADATVLEFDILQGELSAFEDINENTFNVRINFNEEIYLAPSDQEVKENTKDLTSIVNVLDDVATKFKLLLNGMWCQLPEKMAPHRCSTAVLYYCLDYLMANDTLFTALKRLIETYYEDIHYIVSPMTDLENYIAYLLCCKKCHLIPTMKVPISIQNAHQLQRDLERTPLYAALILEQWNDQNCETQSVDMDPCQSNEHLIESVSRLKKENHLLFDEEIVWSDEYAGAVIAGGSVLSALNPEVPHLKTSDVDVFVYAKSDGAANVFTLGFKSALFRASKDYHIRIEDDDKPTQKLFFVPKNVNVPEIKPVQIVYTQSKHPMDVISHFHMDYVKAFYDPTLCNFHAAPEAITSWHYKTIYNIKQPCSSKALTKAIVKGFVLDTPLAKKYPIPQNAIELLTQPSKVQEIKDLTDEVTPSTYGGLTTCHLEEDERDQYNTMYIKASPYSSRSVEWQLEKPKKVYDSAEVLVWPLFVQTLFGKTQVPITETPIFKGRIYRTTAIIAHLNRALLDTEWSQFRYLETKVTNNIKDHIMANIPKRSLKLRKGTKLDCTQTFVRDCIDDECFSFIIKTEDATKYFLDGMETTFDSIMPLTESGFLHADFYGFCTFRIPYLYTMRNFDSNTVFVDARKIAVSVHMFSK